MRRSWNMGSLIRQPASQLFETYRSGYIDRSIIVAFFIINFLFIAIHTALFLLVEWGSVDGSLKDYFALDRDMSFPEMFNYVQAIGCMVFLGLAYRASGQPVYLGWALVFGFVFFDDAQSLHERIGGQLAELVALPTLPYLRAKDTGEMIVWAAAGALILPVLAYGFRRSTPDAVAFGSLFAAIFALLLFFAIGVDMIPSAPGSWGRYVNALLTIAEDGGEMLVLALAFACSLLLYRRLSIVPDAEKRPVIMQAAT